MNKKFKKILDEVHALLEQREFLTRLWNVANFSDVPEMRAAAHFVFDGLIEPFKLNKQAELLRLRCIDAIAKGWVSAEFGNAIIEMLPVDFERF